VNIVDVPPMRVVRREPPPVASYDHLSRAEQYLHRTRDEALLGVLLRHGLETLAGLRVLELGCGNGSLLRSLIAYGATADRLIGIDPAFRRLRRARNTTGAAVAVADGALLPYRSEAFDIVFVFTALSSMVDQDVRLHAAHEALRVLRPNGLIVVYDFWTNPFNASVRPVSPAELRHIFEPHAAEIERVTLAPPIVRLLGGREPLCRPLARLAFLQTHMLAAVVKRRTDG
jgi:ubiquinone/menaquinone biosynthesis C-methylase UbiE